MKVWSLGSGRSLGEGKGAHSSILATRIPGTEKPGGLQSMGSQRVGYNWSDLACKQCKTDTNPELEYCDCPSSRAGWSMAGNTGGARAQVCWGTRENGLEGLSRGEDIGAEPLAIGRKGRKGPCFQADDTASAKPRGRRNAAEAGLSKPERCAPHCMYGSCYSKSLTQGTAQISGGKQSFQ